MRNSSACEYLIQQLTLNSLGLESAIDRQEIWRLLWADFQNRVRPLLKEGSSGSALAGRAALTRLVADRLVSVHEFEQMEARLLDRPRYDVMIVAPLGVEFRAIRTAFGLDTTFEPHDRIRERGVVIYRGRITNHKIT
jgi:hypothetical protein